MPFVTMFQSWLDMLDEVWLTDDDESVLLCLRQGRFLNELLSEDVLEVRFTEDDLAEEDVVSPLFDELTDELSSELDVSDFATSISTSS